MGIRVDRICQMADDPYIIPAVRELAAQHDILILTGGLGPTSDDLTREAVSEAAGTALEFDEVLWENLKKSYGLSKAQANRKQAMVPAGFHVVPNPNGTAPGLWGRIGGCLVCAMPGPPQELEPMFKDRMREIISAQFGLEPPEELEASCFLIPEAMIEDVCRSHAGGGVRWRTRFQQYRISLYLSGGDRAERQSFLEAVGESFGTGLVREGDHEAAELVYSALRDSGKTLVTAESCTGGMIGGMLTDIPGISECYWGGFITYDNVAKGAELEVSRDILENFGAVSEEAVLAMARGALRRSGCGISVAVSGVAGPGGGTPEKPVGTVWIGLSTEDGISRAWRFNFGSRRGIIRRRAAVAALLLVELALREAKRLDMVGDWHYS
jgi:nicotinamide-nucleotide amidase